MDEDNFPRVLELLTTEELPRSPSELLALSDLDREKINLFQSVWKQLSTPFRRRLIDHLGSQALEHIQFQFDRINHLAINDFDAHIRRQAIENLWESEDPRLVSILLKIALEDPDREVIVASIHSLGRFTLLGQYQKIESDDLAQIENQLLVFASSENPLELRSASLEALGYSSRREVEGLIQEAWEGGNEVLQRSAVIAMGRSANQAWIDPILPCLNNPSPSLRAVAARAAGELELRAATPVLIELLEDVHDQVRESAIWSLGQIGGDQARETLQTMQASLDGEPFQEVIEQALEHIAFLEGTPDLLLFDFDDEESQS
jgi:HEAT repeat protein